MKNLRIPNKLETTLGLVILLLLLWGLRGCGGEEQLSTTQTKTVVTVDSIRETHVIIDTLYLIDTFHLSITDTIYQVDSTGRFDIDTDSVSGSITVQDGKLFNVELDLKYLKPMIVETVTDKVTFHENVMTTITHTTPQPRKIRFQFGAGGGYNFETKQPSIMLYLGLKTKRHWSFGIYSDIWARSVGGLITYTIEPYKR